LFEEHITERRIRLVDTNSVHKLLDVVIHSRTPGAEECDRTSPAAQR
jgi:hypothetical protein